MEPWSFASRAMYVAKSLTLVFNNRMFKMVWDNQLIKYYRSTPWWYQGRPCQKSCTCRPRKPTCWTAPRVGWDISFNCNVSFLNIIIIFLLVLSHVVLILLQWGGWLQTYKQCRSAGLHTVSVWLLVSCVFAFGFVRVIFVFGFVFGFLRVVQWKV